MRAFHRFLVAVGLALPEKAKLPAEAIAVREPIPENVSAESSDALMPFDENLLERARTQWQFGDWKSLSALSDEQIRFHPGRSTLRLLRAIGLLQTSPHSDAKLQARGEIVEAITSGVSRAQVARSLIAGVHNSLGLASAFTGRSVQQVLAHINEGQRIGQPGIDTRLTLGPSVRNQLSSLPLRPSEPVMLRLEMSLVEHQAFSLHQPVITRVASEAHTGIVSLPFYIQGKKTRLEFFTQIAASYKVEEGYLYFDFSQGTHNYLMSVESGSFNAPPQLHYFVLQEGASYELTGDLVGEFSETPQVWAFQYSEGKKITANNTRCTEGQFRLVFHVDPKASRGGIGIRLAGKGFIDLKNSRLHLQANSAMALTGAIDLHVDTLKKEFSALIEKQQSRQARESLAQLESFVRLQTYMGPDLLLPDMHGWPISPDLGVLLIRLLEAMEYDLIVEFGSGSSTLIIAEVLRRKAQKTGIHTPFVSFEHLETYFSHTQSLLKQAEHLSSVLLVHAPLVEMQIDKSIFPYYNESLVRTALEKYQPKRIFALVDGPPANTGPLARFPAFSILSRVLPTADLHFLMDDYNREDEKTIVDQWLQAASSSGYNAEKTEYLSLEKHGCLVKLSRLQASP
jgi:hypothetical protein